MNNPFFNSSVTNRAMAAPVMMNNDSNNVFLNLT